MKAQTANIVKGMVNYLNTDAVKPNLTISLKDVKPKIIASLNATIQKKITTSQNQTSNRSLEEIIASLIPKIGSINPATIQNDIAAYCQIHTTDQDCVDAVAAVANPEAQAALIAPLLEAALPDSYDIYQLMGSQQKVQLSNAKSIFKQLNFGFNVMLGIAVAIIIVMALLAWNLKGICKWIGSPLLITGIGLVMMGLFLPATVMKMIPASDLNAQLGTANSVFVQNVLMDVLRTIFGTVMTQGLIVAAIGLLLIVASFFLKPPVEGKGKGKAPKEEKEEDEEEDEEEKDDEEEEDEEKAPKAKKKK
jgi:hypothetical protein